MQETFRAALVPMLTMFSCILVGFFLKRRKLVPENAGTVLSRLETCALVPALSLNTFSRNCTIEAIQENYLLMGFCIVCVLLSIGIAIPLSKLFAKSGYQRQVYKYALAFANFGFMGNAIVPLLFGEQVLFLYMLFTLPLSICCYSWGISQLIPGSATLRGVLKRVFNPSTVAMLLGAALGLTGVGKMLPGFLSQALSSLGACMGPIAMVLTGMVVGGYTAKELFLNGKVYIASALRLIVLPAILCAVLYFLGADRQTMVLMLMAFATPLGLNTVVYAASYGADTRTGASMAIISHALSVLTIPMMYALVTMLIS